MIVPLEQLEQKFLSAAPDGGFHVTKTPDKSVDMGTELSADAARMDVAIFARLLIEAYGGWPFYPQLLRRRILTALSRIYKSISGPITVGELYKRLTPVIGMMPDRHIMLVAGKNHALNMASAIDVGENLAKSRNADKPYLIEKQGRVGVFALSKFFAPDSREHLESIRQQVLDIMTGTDAIIIDLRNNGGGDPRIASMLGATLSGYDLIPHSRRMFARNTKLAHQLQQYIDLPALKNVSGDGDPVMIVDNSKFKMPKNHKWAFGGDIYILANNRSASSSEHVIALMKYNPRTKVVGTHSSGCDQYVNYRFVELGDSGMFIRLPLVYREMTHARPRGFEMHGYAPDIECTPGTDAFRVAMDMISGRDMQRVACQNCRRGKIASTDLNL